MNGALAPVIAALVLLPFLYFPFYGIARAGAAANRSALERDPSAKSAIDKDIDKIAEVRRKMGPRL